MKKSVKAKAKTKSKLAAKPKSKLAAKARAKAAPQVQVQAVAPAPVSVAPVAPATDSFFLKLDASCTLRETADLQFSLVAANGDPLVIDGSDVERIDTAGLQLLVALAQRQRQAGRRLEWKAASPELLKCGARLGLIDALGLAGAGDTP